MTVELYADDAPGTVANFVKLSKGLLRRAYIPYRVIPRRLVVQGGCPYGTGTGGPGYTIKCETSGGRQYHDRAFSLWPHAGRDTGGSQFFILPQQDKYRSSRRRAHMFPGKICDEAGLEVLDNIRRGDVIETINHSGGSSREASSDDYKRAREWQALFSFLYFLHNVPRDALRFFCIYRFKVIYVTARCASPQAPPAAVRAVDCGKIVALNKISGLSI